MWKKQVFCVSKRSLVKSDEWCHLISGGCRCEATLATSITHSSLRSSCLWLTCIVGNVGARFFTRMKACVVSVCKLCIVSPTMLNRRSTPLTGDGEPNGTKIEDAIILVAAESVNRQTGLDETSPFPQQPKDIFDATSFVFTFVLKKSALAQHNGAGNGSDLVVYLETFCWHVRIYLPHLNGTVASPSSCELHGLPCSSRARHGAIALVEPTGL